MVIEVRTIQSNLTFLIEVIASFYLQRMSLKMVLSSQIALLFQWKKIINCELEN